MSAPRLSMAGAERARVRRCEGVDAAVDPVAGRRFVAGAMTPASKARTRPGPWPSVIGPPAFATGPTTRSPREARLARQARPEDGA
ncbi:MAG: hypothetical protein ACFBWO_06135 [Paracoccaceae bacterium]